jgi:hypothetical protein
MGDIGLLFMKQFIWHLPIKTSYGGSVVNVMFYRTRDHTCLYLALLCICDMRALDATDRDALMAWCGLLFMVIVAFCLYNTRCVDK